MRRNTPRFSILAKVRSPLRRAASLAYKPPPYSTFELTHPTCPMILSNTVKKLVSLLTLSGSGVLAAQDVENLWITEVNPSSGQIEVTNVGEVPITTTSNLPFCHRFNYSTGVPANTTFDPGQSRLYTVSFQNRNSSDLWIYADRNFGSSNSLLNGLQWGTTTSIGRTGVAVNGGDWDSTTSAVANPALGQSILLVGPDPFSAANWTTGPSELGTFVLNSPDLDVALELELEIAVSSDGVSLSWTGGRPPFQVFASSDLVSFDPVGPVLEETSLSLPVPGTGRQFYRVEEVAAAPSAVFTPQSEEAPEETSKNMSLIGKNS